MSHLVRVWEKENCRLTRRCRRNSIWKELFKENMSNYGIRDSSMLTYTCQELVFLCLSLSLCSSCVVFWNGLIGIGCRLVNSMIITANLKSHIKFLFFPFEVQSLECTSALDITNNRSGVHLLYSIFPMNLCVYPLKRPNANIIAPKEAQSRNNRTYIHIE